MLTNRSKERVWMQKLHFVGRITRSVQSIDKKTFIPSTRRQPALKGDAQSLASCNPWQRTQPKYVLAGSSG